MNDTLVGVRLNKNSKIYYYSSNGIALKKNDNVLVNTERGPQFGVVIKELSNDLNNTDNKVLDKIIRLCTSDDIVQNNKNINDEKKALKKCRDLIKKYQLNMVVLSASYTFDREQLLFTFLADGRVDFRKLAKDLATLYKTRIELRQIGVRDKAREIGGYGSCGQPLCCSKFLDDFNSVSINMAKNQNIALNPNKINGICGRLLCCLKYEDECYKECNKKLPKVGKKIETAQGEGKVISVESLKLKYKVNIKDKGIVDVDLNESN